MLIQLQPAQISLMWNDIRDSVIKTGKVPQELQDRYAHRVLKNLLSGKYQCWVVFGLDEEGVKRIQAIGVTAILDDNLFSTRNLHVLSLYGYRLLTDEIAKDAFDKLKAYAESNNCERIKLETSVGRIKALAKLVGFERVSTNFSMYLNGG